MLAIGEMTAYCTTMLEPALAAERAVTVVFPSFTATMISGCDSTAVSATPGAVAFDTCEMSVSPAETFAGRARRAVMVVSPSCVVTVICWSWPVALAAASTAEVVLLGFDLVVMVVFPSFVVTTISLPPASALLATSTPVAFVPPSGATAESNSSATAPLKAFGVTPAVEPSESIVTTGCSSMAAESGATCVCGRNDRASTSCQSGIKSNDRMM
mmetsp:Transcript_45407/g.98536  ORF Transcript_45407/g.98536 Transcript_45407/m.98536 type:complete len:214 (+) Transcript_45407:990-1631(+)